MSVGFLTKSFKFSQNVTFLTIPFFSYCNRGQYGGCLNEGVNNSLGVHKDGGWAEFVVVHKNQVHPVILHELLSFY